MSRIAQLQPSLLRRRRRRDLLICGLLSSDHENLIAQNLLSQFTAKTVICI